MNRVSLVETGCVVNYEEVCWLMLVCKSLRYAFQELSVYFHCILGTAFKIPCGFAASKCYRFS